MRVRPLMDCLMSEIGTFSFFDLGVNIISIDHCLSVLPVIHFISESVYVLYVFYILRYRLIRVYSY